MGLDKILLSLLVITSLYVFQTNNSFALMMDPMSSSSPTPTPDSGRPPLAFSDPSPSPTSTTSTSQTCSCTSTDGTCNMTCTYSQPPDMEASCHDKCVYLANLNCTSTTSTQTNPTP